MKGYKGFEKDLICKGKRYAENTIFEEYRADYEAILRAVDLRKKEG